MIKINLLPQRRRRRLIPESGVVAVALLVIGALAGSFGWETWRNRQVAAETAEINRKLVVTRQKVAEVLALEAKIDDLRARESLLQSLEAREVPWSEMLVDLARRTPRDAWLANAAVNGGTSTLGLGLQGSALSYTSVATFMTALTRSPYYSDVDLQAAQRATIGTTSVVQFGLTLSMRPLPLPQAAPTPRAPTPVTPEPSR